jgi:hypothetical protein
MGLSLPSHGDQQVRFCSYRRAALTAHSCVCACMRRWHGKQAVSFCSYSRAAFTAHLCVCACMRAALYLPSHGEQAVSLCCYRRAALTAHSCVCACTRRASLHGEQAVSLCSYRRAASHSLLMCMCMHAALSPPSHGYQEVSLYSYRRVALTVHSCMHACDALSLTAWRTGCKSLLLSPRSTHSSLVCMCMHAARSLPSYAEQAVSL